MTFRHLAFQTACYGLADAPGTAFDYNDWQMALFFDTLFLKVYGATHETVDSAVLHPLLTDVLQCEDDPSFLAFGPHDRPGRLAVSPRDFARFGLLYLNKGKWNGRQLISSANAARAVSEPLPNTIPRTNAGAVEMIPDQRTIGSRRVPDNQCDHRGSYSWLWWVNGYTREGHRNWPDAPTNAFAALGHGDKRGMAVLPDLDLVIAWNDTRLGERPLNEAYRLLRESAADAPMPGQIMPDPETPVWLVYNRDANADGGLDPCVLCGPGDPEGFLYRGVRQPGGARDGDQAAIIAKMAGTGANTIYLQIIRSHGGDGDATHNPFLNSDPAKGLDQAILQQWDGWFSAMNDAGIAILLFFYDDSARIWDTGDAVGGEEQAFLREIVNRFEHHPLLIWCVAEEYEEKLSAMRAKNLAAIIRAEDEHNHVIAVHKCDGVTFDEFAGDPNIGQFAAQCNRKTAGDLHAGMLAAWENTQGRYNVNMSECADHGFGPEGRRKHWAAAMAGAHSMALRWLFDAEDAPSTEDLKACGYLVRFFESTDVNRMAPHDELAHGDTQYVLASPGDSHIAYASARTGAMGVKGLQPGTYLLQWMDAVTGRTIDQPEVRVEADDSAWVPPEGIGNEAALWVRRTGP